LSKPLTFFKKLKLFKMYLNQQQNGVIVDCAFCKSTNIHFCNQLEIQEGDKATYTSTYLCNDCHSACENKQEWFKG